MRVAEINIWLRDANSQICPSIKRGHSKGVDLGVIFCLVMAFLWHPLQDMDKFENVASTLPPLVSLTTLMGPVVDTRAANPAGRRIPQFFARVHLVFYLSLLILRRSVSMLRALYLCLVIKDPYTQYVLQGTL